MTHKTAIQATGLRMRFGRGIQKVVALDNIDLKLGIGEFTVLMGPSGSGKSSLISTVGGLQKPTKGDVHVLGQDIWKLSAPKLNKFRRDHCGFVFQSGGLFPALTAKEQIVIPLTYIGFSKKEAIKRADKALEEVGLRDRGYSKPIEMSGGENQRVSIARMLSKSPDLIFCDEPTSALDGANGERVANLLRQAARRRNAMVLCVTHDTRLRGFADRLIEIEDGQLISDTRTEK